MAAHRVISIALRQQLAAPTAFALGWPSLQERAQLVLLGSGREDLEAALR